MGNYVNILDFYFAFLSHRLLLPSNFSARKNLEAHFFIKIDSNLYLFISYFSIQTLIDFRELKFYDGRLVSWRHRIWNASTENLIVIVIASLVLAERRTNVKQQLSYHYLRYNWFTVGTSGVCICFHTIMFMFTTIDAVVLLTGSSK